MNRRNLWSIGLVASVLFATLLAPLAAQNVGCCSFRVRHNFKVCLHNCPVQMVQWNWFTQAAAWQIGQAPVINTNSGSQNYPIPSSDIQCASAVVGQDCAFSTACARFQVDWIPGTQCVQGFHEAFGRACVRCRQSGANAVASSHIVILCGSPDAAGVIQWQPALDDVVGGECGVRNHDPVILELIDPATGRTRNVTLFELNASGFVWEGRDDDADGWYDSAKLRPREPRLPPRGHITLLKRNAATGAESRLVLRYENDIVVESEATGEFAGMRWPGVGDPLPPEIPVPATYDLPFQVPQGWVLQQITMGGDGESGQPIPRVEGDVNGDGCVDDADLLMVLFAFGCSTGCGPEDVNGDGIVDDADLLIVLFNFGNGC